MKFHILTENRAKKEGYSYRYEQSDEEVSKDFYTNNKITKNYKYVLLFINIYFFVYGCVAAIATSSITTALKNAIDDYYSKDIK